MQSMPPPPQSSHQMSRYGAQKVRALAMVGVEKAVQMPSNVPGNGGHKQTGGYRLGAPCSPPSTLSRGTCTSCSSPLSEPPISPRSPAPGWLPLPPPAPAPAAGGHGQRGRAPAPRRRMPAVGPAGVPGTRAPQRPHPPLHHCRRYRCCRRHLQAPAGPAAAAVVARAGPLAAAARRRRPLLLLIPSRQRQLQQPHQLVHGKLRVAACMWQAGGTPAAQVRVGLEAERLPVCKKQQRGCR